MSKFIEVYTEGILRKVEYDPYNNPLEFEEVMSSFDHEVPSPGRVGREGNIFYLYYSEKSKPDCFEDDYRLYSIRVDNDTGEIVERKGYLDGNPLGLVRDYCIVATGIYIDEDKYTLYSGPNGECLEELEVLTMTKGLVATTYYNNEILRETEYKLNDV
jgi:hypothetical protein